MAALLKRGKVVLRPFGDSQRYDLVIDEGDGRFVRVQVKTARMSRGGYSLEFNTASSYAHRGGKRKGYKGAIDLFAVYSPDLDRVYLVPVDDVPEGSCASLRLPSERKFSGRMASSYEF